MSWEDGKLIFVVREPFKSQVTGTDIGFGAVKQDKKLRIESKMPP